MSYFRDHSHTHNARDRYQTYLNADRYGAIVGQVIPNSETTESTVDGGDHLVMTVGISPTETYEVDINTQSKDGSEIGLHTVVEALTPSGTPTEPFGPPTYGVITDAQLSYQGLGLTDADFVGSSSGRIQGLLEAALADAAFVSIYGFIYIDSPTHKGIHDTHYNQGKANQDGAVAVYSLDGNGDPQRTWFFFKFNEDHIA